MKASFFSIFSIAFCFLAALVVASPVSNAVALETREVSVSVRAIVRLQTACSDISILNNIYRNRCLQQGCGREVMGQWPVEASKIIAACTVDINGYIADGWKPTQEELSHCNSLLYVLLGSIKSIVWDLLGYCGLLGGLLGVVFGLLESVLAIGGSCYAVTGALNGLALCIGIQITL